MYEILLDYLEDALIHARKECIFTPKEVLAALFNAVNKPHELNEIVSNLTGGLSTIAYRLQQERDAFPLNKEFLRDLVHQNVLYAAALLYELDENKSTFGMKQDELIKTRIVDKDGLSTINVLTRDLRKLGFYPEGIVRLIVGSWKDEPVLVIVNEKVSALMDKTVYPHGEDFL